MSILRVSFDESANKDLFKTVLRKVFDTSDKQALVEHQLVYKLIDSSEEYERDMRIAALTPGGEVPEGEPIPIQAPYYGGTKEYTPIAYGNGFRITHRMNKFNKYNMMKRLTKSLKTSQLELKDIILARLWNDPTAATYTTLVGFDTLALASNAHTVLASADTYDNYGDAGLSNASLASALNYFDTLIGDDGQITIAVPTDLIYHTSLRITAQEILRSEGKAAEMSNTKNIFPDWDLTGHVYHRYTSSASWALLAKNDERYDIKCFTQQDPDFDMHGAYDETRDIVCNSLQYFSYGFGDPRMVYIGDI